MKCSKCGYADPEGRAVDCPNCGAPAEVDECPECGSLGSQVCSPDCSIQRNPDKESDDE